MPANPTPAPAGHPAPTTPGVASTIASSRPDPIPASGPGDPARRIGAALADRLGPEKFERWFGGARIDVGDAADRAADPAADLPGDPADGEGPRVRVATATQFAARWIDTHFADDLRGAVRSTLGPEARVHVCVAPELLDPGTAAEHDPAPGAHGRGGTDAPARRSVKAPPRDASRARHRRGPSLRNLDEFVVGHSNRLAFSTATRLLDDFDGAAVSPLFVHGECGVGKTHLLQGICRRFTDVTGRPEHVRYVTGEQFTNEYIASIRNHTVDAFRRRVRKLELLAIDDVHFLSNKVRTQSEFLHTLDAIDLTGARLVLASDAHPRHIKRFSQALVSRFLSGMVVQIDRPDRATRLALVRRLASSRRLEMNDSAVEAVAARCVGSVRELEGAVTKLAALRSLAQTGVTRNGAPADPGGDAETRSRAPAPGRTPSGGDGEGNGGIVGLVLVEQLFQDHGWRPSTPVRIATVIDGVCERLSIARADLLGSSRHRRVVLGRGLVAFLARDLTTHSYPEIARALGRTYHSTIHTAEHRLRRQLEAKEEVETGDGRPAVRLDELVDQLRHEIMRATTRG